jgi:ABC-type dipeptide/oligopeptide/nickel transport system permease component
MLGLGRLLLVRVAILVVSVFAIAVLSFGLVLLVPGDPALVIAGESASEAQIAEVREQLGLADPLQTRFVNYVGALLRGDLGNSLFTGQSVAENIAEYLPNTLELVGLSLVVATVLGLGVGIICAYYRRRWPASVGSSWLGIAQSIPDFVVGLLLIFVLYYLLRWVPAPVGQFDIGAVPPDRVTGFVILDSVLAWNLPALASVLGHMVLPVLTLGLVYSAFLGRVTAASVGQAMLSPQVEFARACGLPERQVIRYALLASRTPILTYGAILFGALIGGEAVVEVIFGWQGVSRWALEGVLRTDLPVIQGFIVLNGVIILVVYLILDLVTALLDPRITYSNRSR